MDTLTVACVNVGDYLGRGQQYVDTLASMCFRHLPPHKFACITESEHPGWWGKLELFRPGRFTGRTVYFDLDVSIRGDLAHLVNLLDEHDFWALDDFAWPLSHASQAEMMFADHPLRDEILTKLGGWGTCNSSVMLWRDEAGADIWNRYSPEAAAGLHGDQNWITRVMGDRLRIIPPGWARSYKLSGRSDAPITVYHGDPKPHQVGDPDWH